LIVIQQPAVALTEYYIAMSNEQLTINNEEFVQKNAHARFVISNLKYPPKSPLPKGDFQHISVMILEGAVKISWFNIYSN